MQGRRRRRERRLPWLAKKSLIFSVGIESTLDVDVATTVAKYIFVFADNSRYPSTCSYSWYEFKPIMMSLMFLSKRNSQMWQDMHKIKEN